MNHCVSFCEFKGNVSWQYVILPELKCATVFPVPCKTHFVVISPSTPTGPRAWILLVLIPTSAPKKETLLYHFLIPSVVQYWFLKLGKQSLAVTIFENEWIYKDYFTILILNKHWIQ